MPDNKYIDVNSLESLAAFGIKRAVIAIGVFDGIHLGHQRLLDSLLRMSKKHNATPVALTFFPHPREVLRPHSPPAQLIPQCEKIRILHEFGIKAVVTIPFTAAFAAMPPNEFIEKALKSRSVELSGICVGKEWRFGAQGSGNTNLLHAYSDKGHFDFEAVNELTTGGGKISSTSIRLAISGGSLDSAEEMLGRPYSLFGTVEAGRQVASDKLNHPTANLRIEAGIIPPNGVYAGFAVHNGRRYKSAIAIGTSPTFKHEFEGERRVEVHILDYDKNIYNEQVEVVLVKYIREERFFPDASELKTQIEHDVDAVRSILS